MAPHEPDGDGTDEVLELDDIVSARCESHELIDNTLRSYLSFTSKYKGSQPRVSRRCTMAYPQQANTSPQTMMWRAVHSSFSSRLCSRRMRTTCADNSSMDFFRYNFQCVHRIAVLTIPRKIPPILSTTSLHSFFMTAENTKRHLR